ncbi:E3 ubiquitin-protein ligase SHPRH [Anopheles ziemanni]|uniref:E3 ubiquitin-protein ligase SHPRH n=1 Tax=Anopheles coustani TaxID=139045 RepID=UPI002658E265|nr:E3 ubiquitin-protein ligase SHPRH [Anopheles coustani]XP_058178774.1 E3 ubiquitin-protein ligase SHPRH [Anopheles ziemanni]
MVEYCLLDVGIRPKVNAEEENWDEIIPIKPYEPSATSSPIRFSYQRVSYHSLVDPAVDIKSLIRDVSRVPEYRLCERTNFWDSSSVILGVFLRMPQNGESFDYGCFAQRQRLIQLLFTETERRCFIEDELSKTTTVEDGSELTIAQFYEQLRMRHRERQPPAENSTLPETIEHRALRPQLRPYQQQAIRWLIERETIPMTLPAQYLRLHNAAVPELDFFADLYTFAVTDEEPHPIPIPTGGILADEMGLGKTVEILALLLFNKHKIKPKQTGVAIPNLTLNKPRSGRKRAQLKCICKLKHERKTIACEMCGFLQHHLCVLKHHNVDVASNTNPYLCPECWRTEPLVESGATIIVSPAAIKHQWASEIRKHISGPGIRLFVYNGVSEPAGSWISPTELSSYDVVLTDYNVLKQEIWFTSENTRPSRHEKRFLSPASPLTMIRWWRVCLDEAQMVESITSNVTKMAKALPSVHRWTVTGTPIEKTINNLYGLVHYLDYEPYSNYPTWKVFVSCYQKGNAEPLLNAMVRIMWRTCKASIVDQLGIPPQTERVHYTTMSDLQRHFYRTEHALCAQAFHEKARKIGRTQSMAEMNIPTLNALMEPLRKLRHDCTIPSILHVANTLPTKKLLTPSELHEHLVTNNVNECKAQLRSVVSAMNGIAGIHILLEEYNQALRLYQASLRMADDYKTGTITVDSLLQIHTLHNLLDLVRSHGPALEPEKLPDETKLREYEEQCARLEWRYIEQYASKVRAVETNLFPAIAKLEELISQSEASKGPRLDGSWWRDIFHTYDRDPTRHREFLNRLLTDIPIENRPSAWCGLDLWLMIWWDKITERRRTLKKGFKKLEFFVENLQPNHRCSPEAVARIEQLVSTAFACHLDPSLATEDADGDQDVRYPAPTCLLCKVKDKLNQLEAVLFLTRQTQAATGGLWQISPGEMLLKQILSHVKRSQEGLDSRVLEEGDHCLAYLERVKQEFKEYSQYWVEMNYTVAAYDELNMCKSRMQLITEEQFFELIRAEKKRTPMQLVSSELAVQMRELQLTKNESERAFVRLQGTLKYLAYLGQKSDIDPCPICQVPPSSKYAVLQCGHHFCSICAINLLKMARERQIVCHICRHQQHTKDIQYVTLMATSNRHQQLAVGNYSDKIFKIVETILDLKDQEPDVKIVIFSHWEPILVKLEVALTDNNITSRQKSSRFKDSISEFKDPDLGITCLLLPLRFGSKGLNLTEATHIFLVEPILNPGEELQAIGRIHRIGQTRPTFVHRFIVLGTIEETIYEAIQKDKSGRWLRKDVTVEQLEDLFLLSDEQNEL